MNYDLLHIPHNLDEVHSKESYIVTLHDVIAYDRAIANNDIKTAKKWQKMASRAKAIYNPQIQISAESETKRSIFREKDKTKRSKKESAQHSKSRNKSFVMTSVSAL